MIHYVDTDVMQSGYIVLSSKDAQEFLLLRIALAQEPPCSAAQDDRQDPPVACDEIHLPDTIQKTCLCCGFRLARWFSGRLARQELRKEHL